MPAGQGQGYWGMIEGFCGALLWAVVEVYAVLCCFMSAVVVWGSCISGLGLGSWSECRGEVL